ncbi:hypothetical protein [Ureibacillus thermophilus]|uniref:Uncharacterized protein n=1 Tax=Ureibacillus thermophilus TaxID=367743 RepID=A0A4P6UR27_9BACL|nr:hypothetical protein [Ureibacillus thermophilus]QBK24501.1 hypothetical protein DKZ56_00380 [Ureibacillus thermophilus]
MLAMSDINYIKHLRNNKGLSISEIQRTMRINWRTAKKCADEDQLPKQKSFKKKFCPLFMQRNEKNPFCFSKMDSF